MPLKLVTPPETEPLTLDEVKAHLRVTSTAEDALIAGYFAAALAAIDGKSGFTGMAVIEQTWDWKIDSFPCDGKPLKFPLAPLKSVTSITYVGDDGSDVTLSTDIYSVDPDSLPGRINLKYGQVWPSARCQANAVTVRAVCGYENAAAVPEPIKSALKLYTGHLYNNREATAAQKLEQIPMGIWFLLSPYAVVEF